MQARPLEEQINSELTSVLRAGNKINEIKKAAYLRDIKKYVHGIHGTYLKAMVHAAYGEHSLAVYYFDIAIQSHELMYYGNYIVYLSEHGSFPLLKKVSEAASDYHETSKLFASYAIEANMVVCDLNNVEKYLNRYIRLFDREDKEMREFVDYTKAHEVNIKKFLEKAELDENSRLSLMGAISAVLEKHNLQVNHISFADGAKHDKYMNVLNISLETNNVELLSEANIDLAFEMAEHDDLLGKNFSIWLSGKENV
ncbi:hypothetical protein BBX45_07570 [Proteus mirabilis]|uniref:hypothetical protein n=1 Tax=Proteus mirabilis TaxID=584 RepID=UPI0008DCCE33|nr:hypothetical protein [Proteus mirabilis]MBI6367356.1 hypothetical protein [Proteus mirabilis]OHY49266.1 hypothetical protein BBX45_07570 [Proteus mirabilis]HCZ8407755.1 hypothetical protein [Proteus mirabilis]HCZ9321715.1 hypothetical protein [Proteus mirabilis]